MAQLHYGDMEARRQLADVDQDDRIHLQGEGYGVMADDQKRSPNAPPPRSSEAPMEVHHERHDPFSGSDSSSPKGPVPSGYGARPVTSGYGNLDLKPEAAENTLLEGATDENWFDRSGIPKEEESMAKELQDHSAAGGGIMDVRNLKDNYVDVSEENIKPPQSADNLPSAAANDEETAQLTSEIKSPVDEPKQEKTSQVDAPIVDNPEQEQASAQPLPEVDAFSKPSFQNDAAEPEQQRKAQLDDDLKQEHTQPCPESADLHGCQAFEGEDGRERLNVEGFNIYSGEPEKVVYDAADVRCGQPESQVGVRGTQDILGNGGKEEEKASLKNERASQEYGEAPENLVDDASYVMGGRPESGIVVKEDGGREMQEVEQEKSLPTQNADMVDVREDAGVNQGSKPLPKAEAEDVRELQQGEEQILNSEEGADVALHLEDNTSIADIKSDDQTGMRQVRNSDQSLDVDEAVDAEGTTHDEWESPNKVGMEDQRKEAGEKRGIAFLDEEEKDMAQEGEQFVLNSPVVGHNTESLPVEQAAELRVDSSQDKDHDLNAKGSSESPYTQFDRGDEYVKAGYGAEGFVPQNNDQVDRELSEPVDHEKGRRQTEEHPLDEPSEAVDHEKGRRQTGEHPLDEPLQPGEHPLDEPLQLDAQGMTDGNAQVMDANARRLGNTDNGKFDEGKVSEYDNNVPLASFEDERPPTMPHPQPEDLARYINGGNNINNNNNNVNVKEPQPVDHEGQHPEGAPHKKGVFERIKEKFTPHNGST